MLTKDNSAMLSTENLLEDDGLGPLISDVPLRGNFLNHKACSERFGERKNDLARECPEWTVPASYDYTKSTQQNYSSFKGDRRCFGRFSAVRASRDFEYHGNYTRARQEFQDSLVRNVVGASSCKDHPWIVFTAGAMGAGKSHTISWMSEQGLFPLPDIVIIDPDQFKAEFPEWPGYCRFNQTEAGRLTRKESGYLVELAQEVAMAEQKNIWCDGSLRDGVWYEQVFQSIRTNHPEYRIAILYVFAERELVLWRAVQRAETTGRHVPVEEIEDSLQRVPRTVEKLRPEADFVAYIKNQGDKPVLTGFCDRSGCHRNIMGTWKAVADRFNTLPEFSEGNRWKAVVDRLIEAPGVLIFSKTYCTYCSRLKALIRHLGIPFKTVELDKQQGGAAMQLELAKRPSGVRTVPQLFAGGQYVGSCADCMVLNSEGVLEPTLRFAALTGQKPSGLHWEESIPPTHCPTKMLNVSKGDREATLGGPPGLLRSLSL